MKKVNLRLLAFMAVAFVLNSNASESESSESEQVQEQFGQSQLNDPILLRCAPYPECAGSDNSSYLEILIEQFSQENESSDNSPSDG